MLVELRVENFAIIDKLNLSFEDGLTVFTGETGAGKSIIIDAISLLVGGRASSDYVRHGADKAEIEALFDIADNDACRRELEAIGIESKDGLLVLRRQISKNGKSVCRANGRLITLGNLRDIGRHLIDIHGQHEHQELMQPEKHIRMLDRFGDEEMEKAKEAYRKIYGDVLEISRHLERLNANEEEIARRLDILQYQIKEIESASLQPGEEDRLLEERTQLVNFEKIFEALSRAYEALNGEQKGLDWLRAAGAELETVRALDGEIEEMAAAIDDCFYIIEEQAHRLRDRLEFMEFDADRLNAVEARLDEIARLKRKYGKTLDDVLAYYDSARKEYEELTHRGETADDLAAEYEKRFQALIEASDRLTALRKKIAKRMAEAVNRELADLYMEKARFDIGIETAAADDLAAFNRDGRDRVEFFISTNVGEPFKPLARVASGGEMSRIMLAIKSHFKAFTGVTSIIFDEVDTGVGGRVAQAMAEKIYQLSKSSQVFCITHLPQVAAMADHHLYISKVEKDRRTVTHVQVLNDDEKVAEIARMISGVEMTELTKQHAKELIQLAEEIKR
ncbi:DNA repair protein RecN [Caenibacillus caldisaponilyticus]|uniref:DNA repair protein RecN n=1 Tax=Caenibacillus caldisaponilyticus TaxID=1674942 RepID=UPI0009884E50|nr:DNA repair protein RecN [Caenibacillus caldisaponilyticus]